MYAWNPSHELLYPNNSRVVGSITILTPPKETNQMRTTRSVAINQGRAWSYMAANRQELPSCQWQNDLAAEEQASYDQPFQKPEHLPVHQQYQQPEQRHHCCCSNRTSRTLLRQQQQQLTTMSLQKGGRRPSRVESTGNQLTVADNQKRRTRALNQAFSNLRQRLPGVPPDTKLSKIGTLRLAIRYITQLNSILSAPAPLECAGAGGLGVVQEKAVEKGARTSEQVLGQFTPPCAGQQPARIRSMTSVQSAAAQFPDSGFESDFELIQQTSTDLWCRGDI